jgi:hypothetical protein
LQARLPLQIRNKARLDGSWQACVPSQTCAIRRSLNYGRYQLNPRRLAAGTRMPASHSTPAAGSHHALHAAETFCFTSSYATNFVFRGLIFSIHVACRKTLYGRQTSSLFLVRLSRLDCPREEILVVALSIVLRRCNSFQHEVFRVCTHPEANFVCRKTSLEIFRPLARTSWAARPR